MKYGDHARSNKGLLFQRPGPGREMRDMWSLQDTYQGLCHLRKEGLKTMTLLGMVDEVRI